MGKQPAAKPVASERRPSFYLPPRRGRQVTRCPESLQGERVVRGRSIQRSNAMSQRLKGKVAVVTGASNGIGASIAKHLADEGAPVVVNYASSKEGAERVVREITGKGGKAIAVQADVAKQADIKRLFAETRKAFGRLDVLVNN